MYIYDGFLKWWDPHFDMIFHYKPFILGVPSFYETSHIEPQKHRISPTPGSTEMQAVYGAIEEEGQVECTPTSPSWAAQPKNMEHLSSLSTFAGKPHTYIYMYIYICILNMFFILMANRCNDINDDGFMSIFPWKPLIRADSSWVQKLDRDDADQVDHVLWHCVMMISRCFGSCCYF